MTEFVFFYGTLMNGFDRRNRARVDRQLKWIGRGSIEAALFDIGIYPAAVPAADSQVWGELYEMLDARQVLPALDQIEGYRPGKPDASLYVRTRTSVTLDSGTIIGAWAYFYNAPLGKAQRIESGDYLQHMKVR
jgi:gamma-glutamylcyclotransferase (GGCT)/AIG2-like uncharacterized protein YtfP